MFYISSAFYFIDENCNFLIGYLNLVVDRRENVTFIPLAAQNGKFISFAYI